jgi:hypothetical protein
MSIAKKRGVGANADATSTAAAAAAEAEKRNRFYGFPFDAGCLVRLRSNDGQEFFADRNAVATLKRVVALLPPSASNVETNAHYHNPPTAAGGSGAAAASAIAAAAAAAAPQLTKAQLQLQQQHQLIAAAAQQAADAVPSAYPSQSAALHRDFFAKQIVLTTPYSIPTGNNTSSGGLSGSGSGTAAAGGDAGLPVAARPPAAAYHHHPSSHPSSVSMPPTPPAGPSAPTQQQLQQPEVHATFAPLPFPALIPTVEIRALNARQLEAALRISYAKYRADNLPSVALLSGALEGGSGAAGGGGASAGGHGTAGQAQPGSGGPAAVAAMQGLGLVDKAGMVTQWPLPTHPLHNGAEFRPLDLKALNVSLPEMLAISAILGC